MSQPWRDLPSAGTVSARFYNFEQMVGRSAKRKLQALGSKIFSYHVIEKDNPAYLHTRETMLRAIQKEVDLIIKESPTLRDENGFLNLLRSRAGKKAAYLKKMRKFFESEEGQQVYSATDLLEFLKAPPDASVEFAHLQSGCRMERLDPYHRSLELHLATRNTSSNQQANLTIGDFRGGMGWAFAQWCGCIMEDGIQVKRMSAGDIEADGLPPFFLWLENHPICTGEDGQQFGAWRETPAGVSSVHYSSYGKTAEALSSLESKQKWNAFEAIEPSPGIHWVIPLSNKVVVEVPLDDVKTGVRLFDTTHLSGKADEAGSAAFVWTQCNTLLVGEHEQGRLHHSSFVGGKRVRCAGMLRVVNGKVDLISNNSGHYRPSESQLREFAKWLGDRQVYGPNATARFFDESGQTAVKKINVFLEKEIDSQGMRNDVGQALDQLAALIGTAAERYQQSTTRNPKLNFFRKLTKSKESKAVLVYLQNQFVLDVQVAKQNTSEPAWWQVPCDVIRALLSEPGSKELGQIARDVEKLIPIIGRHQRYDPRRISSLRRLKQNSTMHRILSEQWQQWKQPQNIPGVPVR